MSRCVKHTVFPLYTLCASRNVLASWHGSDPRRALSLEHQRHSPSLWCGREHGPPVEARGNLPAVYSPCAAVRRSGLSASALEGLEDQFQGRAVLPRELDRHPRGTCSPFSSRKPSFPPTERR